MGLGRRLATDASRAQSLARDAARASVCDFSGALFAARRRCHIHLMTTPKGTAGDKPKLSTILDETERRLAEAEKSLAQGKSELARSKKLLGDRPDGKKG
jgi:hypothetical protein